MEAVIPAVDVNLIKKELTKDKFLRETNNGHNKLYVITHFDSPNIMREIGRLREITFRLAGGGTGKEVDIDKFDTSDTPYKQLIVWDPEIEEIIGGYRYILCKDVKKDKNGEYLLATSRLFKFTKEFNNNYVPNMIELGRSFVQPNFQSTNQRRKGLYALDNLWDGLGAIWANNPEIKYFFGKVTMYRRYDKDARNLLLYFLEKHFADSENLVIPIKPLDTGMNRKYMRSVFSGSNYKEDYKILSQAIRSRGENIPPLINSYMNVSTTMKCFGTVINDHFGEVEETAILITVKDLYQAKVTRHIYSYKEIRSYVIDRLIKTFRH
jgi:hypothetical protein